MLLEQIGKRFRYDCKVMNKLLVEPSEAEETLQLSNVHRCWPTLDYRHLGQISMDTLAT